MSDKATEMVNNIEDHVNNIEDHHKEVEKMYDGIKEVYGEIVTDQDVSKSSTSGKQKNETPERSEKKLPVSDKKTEGDIEKNKASGEPIE